MSSETCNNVTENGDHTDTNGHPNEPNSQNLTVDQKYETMVAKIQRRKQMMCSWPQQKKLLKLAVYLKCQVGGQLRFLYVSFIYSNVVFNFAGRIMQMCRLES